MKMNFKHSVVIIGAIMLTGCSFMSPVKIDAESGYVINTAPNHVVRSHMNAHTLLVMQPETNPVYNTTRIAFTNRPYQISYYSHSHWIESPADMLAPLIAQTLQKTGHYKSVISPPFSGVYGFALRTQIKTLEVDYTRAHPALIMVIQSHIMRASDSRLLASREFKAAVPLHQCSPFGAVVAANSAAAKLLTEMAAWSVRHTH
jgi:cholesterol transport system auxiliary component